MLFQSFLLLAVVSCVTSFSMKMVAEGMSKSVPFLKKSVNLEGMIGNAEFDPFGFSDSYDMKWMREAEIKHGRVSMLAVTGWLVQSAGIHLPGNGDMFETANPIDAFFKVGYGPIFQIIAGIGFLENLNHNGKLSMMDMHKDSDRIPGEFSAPFYGGILLKGKSEEFIATRKLQELKNGRLAMIAIGGLIHQTILQGSDALGPFPNPALWKPFLEFNVFRQ